MKALIIGAAGFAGGYLTDYLQRNCKWSVSVTKMEQEMIENETADIYNLDILDSQAVSNLLKTLRPDYVFHLAALSSVSLSWKEPALTVDVNIKGSINLLEAVRKLDYSPRILLIGSGEEYGRIHPQQIPITENTLLAPGNIYAATKACQNMLGKIYADAYHLDIMMVRSFNHIGPKQSPVFVVSDFCKQVAEIEKGLREPVIMVGNLSAERDFTDVRDVVRAYSLLMEKGKKGETYNIGSGKAISIQEILAKIIALSNSEIRIQVDEAKLRPVDIPVIEADIRKFNLATNEVIATIPIEKTIEETLDYWRRNS